MDKMLNDKNLIFNSKARLNQDSHASLPQALGQSITPNNIKISSIHNHSRSKIKIIENAKENQMSLQMQQQLFRGSSQNPENIGL